MTEPTTTEARIVAAYQRGETLREIAAAEGMTFGSVRNLLLRQEVQLRGPGRRQGTKSGGRPGGSR